MYTYIHIYISMSACLSVCLSLNQMKDDLKNSKLQNFFTRIHFIKIMEFPKDGRGLEKWEKNPQCLFIR